MLNPTWKRRLRRGIAATILLIAAAAGAATWRWTRYPPTTGTLTAPGLERPIEILRGPYGVPHIIAENPRDAYFGLGFCEIQDRAFQLEMFRRAASGRLAEVIGEGLLPIDELSRTIDFRGIAERQLKNSSPEADALTAAFVAGMNAGLKSMKYKPPELALLGIDPEPWTPLDCVAIARLVSWGLAGDYHTEVLFAKIAERIGPERARLLLPLASRTSGDEQASASPVPGVAPGVSTMLAADGLLARGSELLEGLGISSSCSNWIVSGARSKSGKPLFAYDSHQGGAKIPGEVYLAHLVGGKDFDVMGGMIVGSPGVYAGASRDIAFAPTNLFGDVQDLYTIDVDAAGKEYEMAGKRLPFKIREETIRVKGRAEPLVLTVRETVFGPVVTDLEKFRPGGEAGVSPARKAVTLHWTGTRPELRMDGFVTMPLAKDWATFRGDLAHFEAAPQHFGFAATDGTIAYQAIGPLWKRREPSAPWPAPAKDLVEEPLLTLDELPHLLNPPDCSIVTANHRPFDSEKPYCLGRQFIPAARHDRLQELIAAKKDSKMTLDDLQEIGLDETSRFAKEVAPTFAKILAGAKSADARWVGERLAAWDGGMRGDAVEPLLYHALWDETERALLEDDLGPLLSEYAGRVEVSQERVAAILDDEKSPFWDDARTPTVETRADIVERAALAGLAVIEKKLGPDRQSWRWSQAHTITFESYLHGVTAALDEGPFGVPGDADTAFRFGEVPLHEPFKVEVVALLRLFVDMGDPSAIRAVVSTGESGWPFHPHWRDQVPAWLTGKAIRFPREIAEVRATCPEVMTISPAVAR